MSGDRLLLLIPAPLRARLAPAPDSLVADQLRQGRSPWTDAVHLMWSAWIFVTPLFGGGYTWVWLVATLASYPVFLLLYALTLLLPRRRARWASLGMVAMSLALLPVYPAGLSYFVFGCVTLRIGNGRSLPRYLAAVLALTALALLWAWRLGYPWQAFAWLPVLTVIIGVIVSVERTTHDQDLALKLSQDEVRRLAAMAERERIGRDLHDLLGHTLSLITLKLELARKLHGRDAAASLRELGEAEGVARHALAEVRTAVTGIRAADLAAELASARLLLESSHVHLAHDPPPTDLPADIERALALVLREAVTNIARHAQASRAWVRFEREPGRLWLCVEDDGRGGLVAEGNGIAGMHERLRALGGTLALASPPRQGTRLRACVPLPAQAQAQAPGLADAPAVACPQDVPPAAGQPA